MRPDSEQTDRLSNLFDARWESAESLHRWARAAGIEGDLSDPAMLALAGLEEEPLADGLRNALTTIEELASPSPEGLAELRALLGSRAFVEAQEAARAWLDRRALARLGLARTTHEVESRWADAPTGDPFLDPLLVRLRKARFAATARGGPRRARLVRWAFHEDPSRLQVFVEVASSNPWRPGAERAVMVKLAGPPEPWCSCRAYACPHVAPALDAILDALLEPSSALRDELRGALSAPDWQRTLGRLDAALARIEAGPGAGADVASRIAWRVTPTHSGVPDVAALLQKRLKNGRFSAGSPLRQHDLDEVVDPRDRRVVRMLQGQPGWQPEHVREPLARQALRELCGHPHVFLAGPPLRRLDLRASTIHLALEERDDAVSIVPWTEGATVPLEEILPQLRTSTFDGSVILLDEHAARCLVARVDPKVREVLVALGAGSNSFPAEAANAILERASRIATLVPMRIPEGLLGDEVPVRDEVLVRVERTGPVSLKVQILVVPAPGGAALVPGQGVETAPGSIERRRVFVRRTFVPEVAAARVVQRALDLADADEGSFTWARGGDAALDLLVRLGELQTSESLRVEWLSDRWKITQAAQTGNVSIRLASKRDWLGLDGKIEVDGVQLELAEALDAARRGARYVQASADTWVALGDELRERLSLAADQTYASRGGLEASLASLPALEALVADGGELEAALELRTMLERIREAASFEPRVPEGLSAELRPYQVEGFRWLARLAEWGGGGCLADDMGLGKTVQALALLVHRMEEGPALVIAPTSVCGNWVREAERFAPGLRPVIFGEGDRAGTVEGLGPRDLLIVSYSYLSREQELLCGKRFATLILDEAQAIKNAQTERAKAARALQADVRVALSGTPLENHVGELWSLFRVTVPGLLGSWEQFRHRFGLPIERDGDAERKAALSRVLRPFLLRRTKQEVASELPARTDIDDFVELSKAERELYEQARLAAVARVKGAAGSMPPEKARFEVLAAITRLRLASCHPALYDPESTVPSSKLERAVELLVQLREEGHRALVFSQFTTHLGLVRDAAEAAGLRVLYLDGQTPGSKRQELVDAFQSGEADHFFISLKAGGFGLNLTAADFVLHLDPWWNPAVEDQASDRAHRIGQTRPVTVIRLIARKTIEEQILSLHAQKRELVASILNGSDHAGAIGTDDLVRLIEGSVAGGD